VAVSSKAQYDENIRIDSDTRDDNKQYELWSLEIVIAFINHVFSRI
jgi:hypothetical protein